MIPSDIPPEIPSRILRVTVPGISLGISLGITPVSPPRNAPGIYQVIPIENSPTVMAWLLGGLEPNAL